MDATMRATCPTCRSALRIPAEWAGQPVKCKKCGAVVRTKGRPAQAAGTAEAAQLDATGTNGHPVAGQPAPAAFADLNLPTAAPKYNPFEEPGAAPPPVMYDPATGQPLPPGYPYPYPYPAPAAGYPYPYPPAGYPYPVPPGAAPPAAYPYAQPPAVPVAAPAPGYPLPLPAQPYPQPAAAPYPQPVPVPDPVPASAEFKPSEATAAYSGRGRGAYRRHRGPNKFFWVVVCLFLAVGLVLAMTFGTKFIKSKIGDPAAVANNSGDDQNKGQPPPPGPTPPKTGGLAATAGPTPRRLLFIHVSNYLYLNPLTSAVQIESSKGGDLTKGAAKRLAYEWRIPDGGENNQVFLVSDTAPPPDGRAPFRNVITGAYERFFETSRAQDRIVVYFGGHVLAKATDDKEVVYLVPMEGDPDDPASLIPLGDFYAKLAECKATQKVVIWDVCRFNPQRGSLRSGSKPMTESVAKALAAPPPGVQAVLTCQPGENALEFSSLGRPENPADRFKIGGSSFLDAFRHVAEKNRSARNLGPNDPFPVDELAAAVGKRVAEVAAFHDPSAKQTVKVAGTPPETLVAFNAEEPFAKRFDLPAPPKGVAPAEIADITQVLTLPGIRQDAGDYPIANFPFPEELMRPYKSDVPLAELVKKENRDNAEFREKYLFRITVLESLETIRTVWGKGGVQLKDSFSGETSDAVKKDILKEQDYPADVIPRLERVITLLEAVEPMKANEPKLWQAHYEYALGQAKARYAYMQEYNLALGSIRTEVLPQLDPKKGEDGYKLVSVEKLRVKDATKMAEQAREHFQKLIDEYKGTPWAILARSDRAVSLGLAWKPISSQKPDSAPK